MKSIGKLDLMVVKKCNSFLNPAINPATKMISWVPLSVFGWFFVLSAIALFDRHDGAKIFLAASIAIAIHFIWGEGILKKGGKRIGFYRRRPYVAYPDEIVAIGGKFSDSSFPSSHVASTVAILTVLVAFYPAFIFAAIAVVFLVSFARMHNGMHFFSDVVAGIFLGIVYAMIAISITGKML